MKYIISHEAGTDLENIWLYTYENWSLQQADRYVNLILDEFEYLAQNPESGKDYQNLRIGYRASKIKSHLIFYFINYRAETIEIVRILHQRMDIQSHLIE